MKLTCATIYYTILQHVLQDVPRLLEHSNEHVRTVNCNMLVFFFNKMLSPKLSQSLGRRPCRLCGTFGRGAREDSLGWHLGSWENPLVGKWCRCWWDLIDAWDFSDFLIFIIHEYPWTGNPVINQLVITMISRVEWRTVLKCPFAWGNQWFWGPHMFSGPQWFGPK